jgi:TatD DNase family protein
MFVDTHTHLYDDRLTEPKQDEMIRRAFESGVNKLYMPNCDQTTIAGMMRIAGDFPGQCLPMMGLHPTYVKEDFEAELAIVREWLDKETFAAIGEIGLDYYWDNAADVVERQKIAFGRQIDWALEKGLPIVIHSRDATPDCIDIVRRKQTGSLRGIFHCFSGSLEEAEQIIALDFKIGIGGIITYKSNRELQDVVSKVPLESIVLETDAPYLSPVPYRGKRNESGYIPFIAEKIAELRNLSIEELGRITTETASKLFPC